MKTNLFITLFIFSALGISAQGEVNSNLSFGVLMSAEQTKLQYSAADWVFSGENGLKHLSADSKVGYAFGIEIQWRVNPRSSFRISPMIARQQNRLVFTEENNSEQVFKLQPVSIGVPIHYVFSPRGKSQIPYFFFGPRFHQTITKKIDPSLFSISSFDVSAEIGIGAKIQQKKFAVSPQLSFSQGVTDLKVVGESGLYNNAIRSMWRSRLSLGIIISR